MLSTSAFNALLKSLEEPPPNTIFILATTELHKIPETVLSRCQRHTLRALPINLVEEELAKIANAESIQCEPEALRLIARLSDGSMRDAQSLLDRVSAYVDTTLTEEETGRVLGVVGKQGLFKLSAAIIERDSATALLNIHDSFLQGVEPGVLLRDFAHHWRDLLLIRFGAQAAISALHLAPEEVDEAKRQIGQISAIDLQDLVDLARSGADEALRSVHPRYALESLIVRMSTREPTHDLVKLVGTAVASLKSGKANAVPLERSSVKTSRGQGVAPALPPAGEISVAAPKKVVATAAEQALAARNNQENQPASSTSHAQSRSGEPLRWENFVDATAQTGSRILGEHLRRLVVHTFERGVLEASGAEFTVASLSRGAGLERLQQALQSFSGTAPWRINLSKSGSEENTTAPLSASIEGKEIANRQKSRQKKEEIIRQEPGVKAILEAFPGSTIERIDILENKK
jgi:DNA polymerase-3 subunit gamma/tau